ncbi:hypothetical protein GCM10011403_14600 [Pseudohongiella nitratireducens]|uniref:Uncharacterized protein n=1 Tax=Pseudohongiella nitratireducens TaxID=1768907 RepID=A0A917LVT9_9GAMM|nr:hypothetical protein GCM10011403_14600 [Pseudohongiella nitratireducens]
MDAIALKRIMSPVFGREIHRFAKGNAFSVPNYCCDLEDSLTPFIYNSFYPFAGTAQHFVYMSYRITFVHHFSALCTLCWHRTVTFSR